MLFLYLNKKGMRKLGLALISLFFMHASTPTTVWSQHTGFSHNPMQMNLMDAMPAELMYLFSRLIEQPELLLSEEFLPAGLSLDDLEGYSIEISIEFEMVQGSEGPGLHLPALFPGMHRPKSILQVNDPFQLSGQVPIWINWDDQEWHPEENRKYRMKEGSIGNWRFQIGPGQGQYF